MARLKVKSAKSHEIDEHSPTIQNYKIDCISARLPVVAIVPFKTALPSQYLLKFLIDFDKYWKTDMYWESETSRLFHAIRTTYVIAVCGSRQKIKTKWKENSV